MKEFFRFKKSFLGILLAAGFLFLGLNEQDDPEALSLIIFSLPWSILILFIERIFQNSLIVQILYSIGVFINSLIAYRLGQEIDDGFKGEKVIKIVVYLILSAILLIFAFASINDAVL